MYVAVKCESPLRHHGLVSKAEGAKESSVGPVKHYRILEHENEPLVCAHKTGRDIKGVWSIHSKAIGGMSYAKDWTLHDGSEEKAD